MPWDATSFKTRHNRKLTGPQAGKAAKQATAILRSGASEGVAIATANKFARKGSNAKARTGKSKSRTGK